MENSILYLKCSPVSLKQTCVPSLKFIVLFIYLYFFELSNDPHQTNSYYTQNQAARSSQNHIQYTHTSVKFITTPRLFASHPSLLNDKLNTTSTFAQPFLDLLKPILDYIKPNIRTKYFIIIIIFYQRYLLLEKQYILLNRTSLINYILNG